MTITRTPEIQTFCGWNVNFADPRPETIDIIDIAHALAQINRYTGHAPFPYSVAQHSVLVSYQAPAHLAFEALMHDAQEAYVGDVSTTLKQLLPDYKAIEDRLERVIRAKYGLPLEMTPEVKEIDSRMLCTEARQLGFVWWKWLEAEPFPGLRIDPWTWQRASLAFIRRFEELS